MPLEVCLVGTAESQLGHSGKPWDGLDAAPGLSLPAWGARGFRGPFLHFQVELLSCG